MSTTIHFLKKFNLLELYVFEDEDEYRKTSTSDFVFIPTLSSFIPITQIMKIVTTIKQSEFDYAGISRIYKILVNLIEGDDISKNLLDDKIIEKSFISSGLIINTKYETIFIPIYNIKSIKEVELP